MKKLLAAILALVLLAVTAVPGMAAVAGTLYDYWDYEQEDGTYAYVFPRMKISMDPYWYRHTMVISDYDSVSVSFYHRESFEAYIDEGIYGGLLFRIGASVNTDFQELPSFVYLGYDEEESLNYYAELPTDYQAYAEDEEIRAQYDALFSGVEEVLATVEIASSEEPLGAAPEEFEEAEEEVAAGPRSSGDFDYLLSDGAATITGYTGAEEALALPAEIDGYQVIGIGDEAFQYQEFESVSIPEGVRVIGEQAFAYCDISEALSLPEGVTISRDAFCYAELPEVVVIPAGATVEERAFSYCESLEQVFIEPDVTLKSRAFGYCEALTRAVCAPGSRLEAKAFEYCDGMKAAILCGDVRSAEGAIYACGDVELTLDGDYEALKRPAPEGDVGGGEQASGGLDQLIHSLYEGVRGKRGKAAPEDAALEILGGPAELDGAILTLTRATAAEDARGFTYTLEGTLENDTDVGISRVIYSVALIDGDGEEFRSFGLVYDGGDSVIPPHAAIDIAHDDIRWGGQPVPAAVKVSISSVENEIELPPVRVPKPGELLYQALGNEKLANINKEPPVELAFHVDQGGYGRTATFRTGADLDRALELFCSLRIAREVNEWATDNYNWIALTWEDGTQLYISLNLTNLEYYVHSTPHMYELDGLDAFWSYCADYLEED